MGRLEDDIEAYKLIKEVTKSISQQIDWMEHQEMETIEQREESSIVESSIVESSIVEEKTPVEEKERVKLINKLVTVVVLMITSIICMFLAYGIFLYSNIVIDDGTKEGLSETIEKEEGTIEVFANSKTKDYIKEEPFTDTYHVSGVYHILFLLEDSKEGKTKGILQRIMLVTIHTKEKKIRFTIIDPDLYVYESEEKEGALKYTYQNGGITEIKRVFELNFALNIDYYLLYSYQNIKEMVDELDGISVILSKEELENLQVEGSSEKISQLKLGENTIDGEVAMEISRLRRNVKHPYSALQVTQLRQQKKILDGIMERLLEKSFVQWNYFFIHFMKGIRTDISVGKLIRCAYIVLKASGESPEYQEFPFTNFYEEKIIEVESKEKGIINERILVPELAKNMKQLHNYVFGSLSDYTDGSN